MAVANILSFEQIEMERISQGDWGTGMLEREASPEGGDHAVNDGSNQYGGCYRLSVHDFREPKSQTYLEQFLQAPVSGNYLFYLYGATMTRGFSSALDPSNSPDHFRQLTSTVISWRSGGSNA